VRGGFPLLVELHWCPAEPDVGLMHSYYEIARVMTESRRSASFLKLTDDEVDQAIEEQL
jgi:hypothetical protein